MEKSGISSWLAVTDSVLNIGPWTTTVQATHHLPKPLRFFLPIFKHSINTQEVFKKIINTQEYYHLNFSHPSPFVLYSFLSLIICQCIKIDKIETEMLKIFT